METARGPAVMSRYKSLVTLTDGPGAMPPTLLSVGLAQTGPMSTDKSKRLTRTP